MMTVFVSNEVRAVDLSHYTGVTNNFNYGCFPFKRVSSWEMSAVRKGPC